MHRTRHLGVREGNAIDAIITYEMRAKRNLATPDDRKARDKAYKVLGLSTSESSSDDTGAFETFLLIGALALTVPVFFFLLKTLVGVMAGLTYIAHP